MKEWRIPVTWEECSVVKVEANTLKEAMEIAYDEKGEIPLPSDGNYVDGSWSLTESDTEIVRELYNDNQEDEIEFHHMDAENEKMAVKINELSDDDFYDVMMCLAQRFGKGTSYTDIDGFCKTLNAALHQIQNNLVEVNGGMDRFLDVTLLIPNTEESDGRE